ncbi:PLxRFG domain-containing protein [Stenotrophomonas sp. NRRL B-14846]|uniref:PLxRFG domain-containing protein n=1 Tax=Stenotrophomonas sp. NRRL B-14846 TaxID=3162882 RepID=UPI003D2D4F6C
MQRFGQFWISATDAAGEPAFLMYEKVEQWREAQRELPARGFTVKKAGRKLDEARSLAGASGGFMADLQELLANAGIDESTRDDVYQLYLRTLPELSVRKHQIHRKGTAGYSADALRSFSSNLFHGSFQVARLRHAHELDADLMDMKAAVDRLTESDPERAPRGRRSIAK